MLASSGIGTGSASANAAPGAREANPSKPQVTRMNGRVSGGSPRERLIPLPSPSSSKVVSAPPSTTKAAQIRLERGRSNWAKLATAQPTKAPLKP